MPNEQIFIILSNSQTSRLLEETILVPHGYRVTQIREAETLELLLDSQPPDLIILEDKIADGSGLELAAGLQERHPLLPLILVSDPYSEALLLQALRSGIWDYLFPPFDAGDVLGAVEGTLQRQKRISSLVQETGDQTPGMVPQRVKNLEALQQIGRQVTSILDLDNVLAAVVDAAVDITGAEEGSLLLVDENSGELYMRAARNFHEDFVRKFRLPIEDTLPGEVLRTGQPLLINTATPKKIKTSYLVHTLMYVPMTIGDRVVGVLGVDNRRSGQPFSSYHLEMMHALADYAAIAVENARLFADSEVEREKYETLLSSVQDSIIILDQDNRVLLVNPAARAVLELEGERVEYRPYKDVIHHPDLIELLADRETSHPYRGEVALEDGRVLSAQVTPIPEMGIAVVMQDITYLKELDRIKTDFVNTISHDLRSPLTAIQGYIELVRRVGPLNEQQLEFTRRIQSSVQNITTLINDLLELGRIEAGFDARKEVIPLSAVIRYAVESMQGQAAEKEQTLELELPEALPHVLGNPLYLRQMFTNLIENALQYSTSKGQVKLRAQARDAQVIVQITDTGIGVPLADQPYIFDKFYRGSNLPPDSQGTGLGLAIVKIIVENHRGRIWIESVPGKGSTFTIILPTIDQEL